MEFESANNPNNHTLASAGRHLVMSYALPLLLLVVGAPHPTWAQTNSDFEQGFRELQKRWIQVDYRLEGEEQLQAIEALLAALRTHRETHPKRAEPLVLEGIVLSNQAAIVGGLRALDLIKQARKVLEQALEIDATVMEGSAHARLGEIYAKVPEWPLAFGNDKIAQDHFKEALEIAPEGMEANYFYAGYLTEKGDYENALTHYLRAWASVSEECQHIGRRERGKEIAEKIEEIEMLLEQKSAQE